MIFGTPGSGKGTQANLLEWTKGFYHFDSGKELRSIIYDPARQSEKLIQRERALNEAGKLNTPSWVLSIFKKEARKIGKAGMSIVYSGSPRTMYEAFGDPSTGLRAGTKTIGLVAFLERLYGKEHVHFFFMRINPEVAAGRNKIRRTCTVCNNPILGTAPVTLCPLCMGPLQIRKDDDPEKYKVRYNEYMTRTMPIVDELRKRGVHIVEIDAEPGPPEIFTQIKKHLGL